MSTPAPLTAPWPDPGPDPRSDPCPDPAHDPWRQVRLRLVDTPGPALDPAPVTRLLRPGVPSPRPHLLPGPRPGAPQGPPARRRGLPDPGPVAHRLVTMTLEAFGGRRPFAQLRSAYTLPVFTAVSQGRRPHWCVAGSGPLLVGAVRVAEPVEGVAEVCAVARRNGRAHAVAARLEVVEGGWRCTALQVG
ncbi:Rv3235 family protein [Klenkia brasiliensis]|uniref:Uncharacterized protein n=1 Tax=Klenkia brasiliensis TaxID=333142 RepID=A0A1G7WAQ4_9ACTN|nr:Rv3235 family protein [Klenkia brasiliensis]SDG69038.1 hypothetical protein SAMN05660324_3256 [Klenkia brasiliensis]